ncbi:peroxiredoxin-like family protein [Nocardia cyriacigeorgica]|uniref:peroxiredoxin-like family protein n=1 Tax=Nocardia cyriacigeorgica TaxID=135487 RepID=UPI0013D0D89D|nr:peroxiredoxin-like family protein [Nocardia cyriacigeorgica]MBF6437062.1 AhpC/TSA family protein [Nocardia cyriacigeorgica]NEW26122.1 AhpC/TSA family protein [Nocardia cyriacigeorgica]
MPFPSAVAGRQLVTITGTPVPIPDPDCLVHLQFRRFAGCPVCSLHLRSVVDRLDEIHAANVREVVVFHSSAEELLKYTADLPLAVIADPGRRLYREFGVESAPRALLDPRAWPTILRAITREVRASRTPGHVAPPGKPEGGRLGLPADFLIAPDGRVVASKHGAHADDQWSVDELLSHATKTEVYR